MINNPDDLKALEFLIDRTSVVEVLEALAGICQEKADHVATNWQDHGMARDWNAAGVKLAAWSNHSAIRRIVF